MAQDPSRTNSYATRARIAIGNGNATIVQGTGVPAKDGCPEASVAARITTATIESRFDVLSAQRLLMIMERASHFASVCGTSQPEYVRPGLVTVRRQAPGMKSQYPRQTGGRSYAVTLGKEDKVASGLTVLAEERFLRAYRVRVIGALRSAVPLC